MVGIYVVSGIFGISQILSLEIGRENLEFIFFQDMWDLSVLYDIRDSSKGYRLFEVEVKF